MKTIHRYYLAAALCLMGCAACTDATDVPGADDGTLAGDKPVFWPEKAGSYKLAACYPLPGEYNITDQSTPEKLRQADFLVIDAVTLGYTGSTPVGLQFRHALAKVRVELTGVSAGSGEIKVEIWNSYTILLLHESVSHYTNYAYITACRDTGNPATVAFEAMVPATSFTKQDFLRITIGDREYRFTPDDASPTDFKPGRIYTYRVDIPSSNP